jgi:glycosyltransferase involved in cell wall biosynthesis
MSDNKILFVIDRYVNPNAGTEGQLLKLVNGLNVASYECRLLVLENTPWIQGNNFPCKVDCLGSSSIKSFTTWYSLIKLAKDYKKQGFKLAHVFFNDSSVICPLIFRIFSIKTVISRRDMGFWYNKTYKALLPITGKFVAGVLTNSNAVKEITSEIEKISLSKIDVIYNGIEIKNLAPMDEIATFKGQSKLIGLVANIRKIKRIEDAIKALSYLKDLDVKLLIVGAGDTKDLQGVIDKYQLREKVLFTGGVSYPSNYMQYVDVGVQCSESEGLSNTIIEFQMLGKPVICTNVGGNPEAIENDITGFLYQVADVKTLASYLKKLLVDDHLYNAFSERSKSISVSKFSYKLMILSHIKYYERVLEK